MAEIIVDGFCEISCNFYPTMVQQAGDMEKSVEDGFKNLPCPKGYVLAIGRPATLHCAGPSIEDVGEIQKQYCNAETFRPGLTVQKLSETRVES